MISRKNLKIENKNPNDKFGNIFGYIDNNSNQHKCGHVKFLIVGTEQINEHTFKRLYQNEVIIETLCSNAYKTINPNACGSKEVFNGERLRVIIKDVLECPIVDVSVSHAWKGRRCMCDSAYYDDYEDDED